jgi:hypothetical protein
MDVMDGRQKKVIKKMRETRKKEKLLMEKQNNTVKKIILSESSNLRMSRFGKYGTSPVKRIIQKSPENRKIISSNNKPIIQKKVSPIIISKYKDEQKQTPSDTRKSSLESKKRISSRLTERVYLSSTKPKSPIQRIKINKSNTLRSVSPLLNKKPDVRIRGKSAITRPKIAKVFKIQKPVVKQEINNRDIVEQNEQKILDQNRRENLEKEQIKKIEKQKPIYRRVDPKEIHKVYPPRNTPVKIRKVEKYKTEEPKIQRSKVSYKNGIRRDVSPAKYVSQSSNDNKYSSIGQK